MKLKRCGFTVSVLALSGFLFGCGASAKNESAQASIDHRAFVGQTCEALKDQPLPSTPVGILLEVADVEGKLGAPLTEWLATHPVPAHSVAGLSVPMNEKLSVSGPFGACWDEGCVNREDGTLQVRAVSLPTEPSATVELQLEVVIPSAPPRTFTVKTANQEPVLIELTTPPKQTLVITPYYLFEPKKHSLKLLAQCVSRKP